MIKVQRQRLRKPDEEEAKKKKKERKENMNERTYMQIGSRKLRHMRKDPRGVGGGGRTECRIRWALAMFANLDTLWQI